MAIIININLSSANPEWCSVAPGPLGLGCDQALLWAFLRQREGTQTSKPSTQWNITSFSLLLFTRSQWRTVRAKAFYRTPLNENAWCRNAFTGEHQAGIIKSVISPACSLELGHMVELFRLMKKIPQNFNKNGYVLLNYLKSLELYLFYGPQLAYLLTQSVQISLKYYCI